MNKLISIVVLGALIIGCGPHSRKMSSVSNVTNVTSITQVSTSTTILPDKHNHGHKDK